MLYIKITQLELVYVDFYTIVSTWISTVTLDTIFLIRNIIMEKLNGFIRM